jgi:cytochrome c5
MRAQARSVPAWTVYSAAALFVALLASSPDAQAQRREREGKVVVDAVCASCHFTGKDNSPRIGDAAAWAARASQGLTSLTANAIAGIRKMPAHGGNRGVSDIEIERAIVHMVNLSGGNWVEPVGGMTPAVLRTSESVVQAQCAKCHQPGKEGAPRIGDRAAWTPRMAKGLDNLVTSSVHGHGGMPARGGMPDLSRDEIRGAILYMFNHGLPPLQPAVATAAPNPHHKVVDGMDVYFGIIKAEAMRAAQPEAKIPAGKGYYHLNVAVADNKSNVPVSDAQVTMRVTDGMTTQTKTLGLIAVNNAVSYGDFFRFNSGGVYNIRTEIKRPNGAGIAVANFEHREP